MKFLRDFLDKQGEMFHPGGKFEKMYPLYEAIDTFVYTPGEVAEGNTHVRDGIDLKRTMISVAIALGPIVLWCLYNTGYQANLALSNGGLEATGWRADIMAMIGLAHDPANLIANIVYGALFFVPIFLVTQIAGGTCELIFSVIRKHEINEGFLVTGLLYPLTLSPTIPLWQVAVGIIFGVVIGKEIFGGTGKNIFNPALTGRAFLFFAYPAQISGDKVWTAVDGYSMATPLAQAAQGGVEAITWSWNDAFLGLIPGSLGETSTVLALAGAAFLLLTKIASWRIMLSMVAGMALTATLFNLIGSESNPMFSIPWHWHFVIGSFAFACVFMATDPVSASMTLKGKYVYGFLIGVLGVLIRVVNPAYPEGWMLAILFMNGVSPLIDYFVMESNIKRRMARNG